MVAECPRQALAPEGGVASRELGVLALALHRRHGAKQRSGGKQKRVPWHFPIERGEIKGIYKHCNKEKLWATQRQSNIREEKSGRPGKTIKINYVSKRKKFCHPFQGSKQLQATEANNCLCYMSYANVGIWREKQTREKYPTGTSISKNLFSAITEWPPWSFQVQSKGRVRL